MKMQDTLTGYIEQSLRDNWERPALSDYHGTTLTYKDVARKIAKLQIAFKHAGLKPGDKIALCGRNSAQWAVAAPRFDYIRHCHCPYSSRLQAPIRFTTSSRIARLNCFLPTVRHGKLSTTRTCLS